MSETLRQRLERLLALMEKNERDRELSRYWRWGDGRMMTRAEWEAQPPDSNAKCQGRDFHGEPIA